MVGAIVDGIIAWPRSSEIAERFSLTVEQVGLKVGILIAALFPLLGLVLLFLMRRTYAKRDGILEKK